MDMTTDHKPNPAAAPALLSQPTTSIPQTSSQSKPSRSATVETWTGSDSSTVPTCNHEDHPLKAWEADPKLTPSDATPDAWIASPSHHGGTQRDYASHDPLRSHLLNQHDSDQASLLQPSDPKLRRSSVLPAEHLDDHERGGGSASQQPEMVLLSSHEASHAPSYGDLFFDLLFAACLNTYSNAVSLEKFANVAAFIGYFTALWWAWWSQAYFDVRYRRPSHYHPYLFTSCQLVVRAVVLGLWVAFSTTPSEFSRGSFTNFTLIYGCSRLALALDHTVVLTFDLVSWHKRHSLIYHTNTASDASHTQDASKLSSRNNDAPKTGRRDDDAIILRTHLVSIVSLVFSGLLWILSRLVRHNGVTAPLLVMWILGVSIEATAQILNELNGVLSPLATSVLPERLVLFGLIILGEGFTGIAETLNKISPGAKDQRDGQAIASGGWGGDTILQAVSCVLIIILQFGGYFHRATSQIDMRSVFVVLWAYIHVLLHMSSALLVVGLKKILGFQNTLNALEQFFNYPQLYLPNTAPWNTLTPDQVSEPYNDGNGTSPLSTNGTLAGISSVIAVIQSNDGASIPNLDQAQRLVASVVGLAGGPNETEKLVAQVDVTDVSNAVSSQFASSLVLPFKSYFEFADNVVNPDSVNQYIVKSLFQFKYIYVASAAYLAVDIVIKAMQSSDDRKLRSFRLAMALRFGFAILLVLLQVVFTVYEGAPTNAALDGALAIIAGVLMAELISQQVVDALRSRLDRPRAHKSKFTWGMARIGQRDARPARRTGSESLSDKDGDEAIEMESHQMDAHLRNRPTG